MYIYSMTANQKFQKLLWVVLQVIKRDAISYTVSIKKYISDSWFLKFTKQIKLKFCFNVILRF